MLEEIFAEMLIAKDFISPLKSPPKPKSNASFGLSLISAIEDSNDEHSNSAENSDDAKNPESEEGGRKAEIAPSKDLRTAISFRTPNKDEKQNKNETPSADSHASAASNAPVKILKPNSEAFRPRRFSCEAPEKAVAVPPIKLPASGDLCGIRTPTITDSTVSFPQRRKDIPSHWHSNVSMSVSALSEKSQTVIDPDIDVYDNMESNPDVEMSGNDTQSEITDNSKLNPCDGIGGVKKDVEMSDDDTQSEITDNSKLNPCDGIVGVNNDVEMCANDTQAKVDPVDSVRESADKNDNETRDMVTDSDLTAAENSNNRDDVVVEDSVVTNVGEKLVVIKKGEADKEAPLKSEIMSDDVTKERQSDDDSSADCDAELVIDISDDAAGDSQHDSVPEESRADTEDDTLHCAMSVQKDVPGGSVDVNTTVDSRSDVFELEKFEDLPRLMRETKRPVKIAESFILDEIVSIMKRTCVEVNLMKKQSDAEPHVAIHHLPLCEQKFLKRMRVLHCSGVVCEDAILTTVIPFFMRILKKLIVILPNGPNRMWDDPDLTKLEPHAQGANRLPLSLAQGSALHRAFFFLCKMTKVSVPVFALCHYDLLSHRSNLHVGSMVDGLCCWPEVLLLQPNFGKILLNGIHKHIHAPSTRIGNIDWNADMLRKLTWIHLKIGWQMCPNIPTLHKTVLDDVMDKVKSANLREVATTGDNEKQSVTNRPFRVFERSVYLELYALEALTKDMVVPDLKKQVVTERFWPILQSWSAGHISNNRTVSDGTIVAVLESFGCILSYYLLKQKQQHKRQPTLPHLQETFETVCFFLHNLATRYFDNCPRIVRSYAAAFLIRTSFCNPTKACVALLAWAKSLHVSEAAVKGQFAHPEVDLTVRLVGKESAIRICKWIDQMTSTDTKSLVEVLSLE